MHSSSNSVEWSTRKKDVEFVILRARGSAADEPCGKSKRKPKVLAKEVSTKSGDGLGREWGAKVYMDPIRGQVSAEWPTKLVGDTKVSKMIKMREIVPSQTNTEWFRRFDGSPAHSMVGRLEFGKQENSAPLPSRVAYSRKEQETFVDDFVPTEIAYQCVTIAGGFSLAKGKRGVAALKFGN